MEKLAERDRQRRDEIEKIKMARKKQSSTQNNDVEGDDFDVTLDSQGDKKKHTKRTGARPNSKKTRKDQKFGFGGPKRNIKSNTADSVNDFSSASLKRMKGKGHKVGKRTSAPRMGKSKRTSMRAKK